MGFYLPPFKNMMGGRRNGKSEAADEQYWQGVAHGGKQGERGKGSRTMRRLGESIYMRSLASGAWGTKKLMDLLNRLYVSGLWTWWSKRTVGLMKSKNYVRSDMAWYGIVLASYRHFAATNQTTSAKTCGAQDDRRFSSRASGYWRWNCNCNAARTTRSANGRNIAR